MAAFSKMIKEERQETSHPTRDSNQPCPGHTPYLRSMSHAHRTLGNQAVRRWMNAPQAGTRPSPLSFPGSAHSRQGKWCPVQAKMKVTSSDDAYEKEADHMAETLLRPKSAQGGDGIIDSPSPLAQSGGKLSVPDDLERRIKQSSQGGACLPEQVRSAIEPRMNSDFSSVKIHTDQGSAQLNRELGSRAFTHGRDIYFGTGQYSPQSSEGRRLVAHELTHVVQQTGSHGTRIQLVPMRNGRRRRTLAIRWGNFDQFITRVRAQSVRQLGVPGTWQYQLLSEDSLRPVYDQIERLNPLRPDGDVVRIIGDFTANGEVGNSTVRFTIPQQPPSIEETGDTPEQERDDTDTPEQEHADTDQPGTPRERASNFQCQPHRPATAAQRLFWSGFFSHHLSRRLLDRYMDGTCEPIRLTHQEMVDCDPQPDINVYNSDRFNTECNRLIRAGGGSSDLSFSALHVAHTTGTLGNFTVNFTGRLTVDIHADPPWTFEGTMNFYDVYDFDPRPFGTGRRPWHAEVRVRVAHHGIAGSGFQITSEDVPVRQSYGDAHAQWRQGQLTLRQRQQHAVEEWERDMTHEDRIRRHQLERPFGPF